MYIKKKWERFGEIGRRWELLQFDQRKPPSWAEFWATQRAYWNADSPDKRRVQLYFGTEDTEANLLAKTQKGYVDFCDHLLKWHGVCKVGEKIDVVLTHPNIIVLTKEWQGEIRDHTDVEIELSEERRFLFHKRYCCEMFTYGTITIPAGSIEAQMGERVGSSRISRRLGSSKNRIETVGFDRALRTVAIDDAVFKVVS
jgi:hypothetical protein